MRYFLLSVLFSISWIASSCKTTSSGVSGGLGGTALTAALGPCKEAATCRTGSCVKENAQKEVVFAGLRSTEGLKGAAELTRVAMLTDSKNPPVEDAAAKLGVDVSETAISAPTNTEASKLTLQSYVAGLNPQDRQLYTETLVASSQEARGQNYEGNAASLAETARGLTEVAQALSAENSGKLAVNLLVEANQMAAAAASAKAEPAVAANVQSVLESTAGILSGSPDAVGGAQELARGKYLIAVAQGTGANNAGNTELSRSFESAIERVSPGFVPVARGDAFTVETVATRLGEAARGQTGEKPAEITVPRGMENLAKSLNGSLLTSMKAEVAKPGTELKLNFASITSAHKTATEPLLRALPESSRRAFEGVREKELGRLIETETRVAVRRGK